MGVRVCLDSTLSTRPPLHFTAFSSRSLVPPQSGVRPFPPLPPFISIYSYLFGVRSFCPLCLPPFFPPDLGSLPRSGASGAPPLARRDVARGDVDAVVSGALDVCAQPGPGLQDRRRPLRRLLEQQQPQVRRWGRAESRGTRTPGPCGRGGGGGGDQRAEAAGGAHPGACITRALEPPVGSAPVAPLFVKQATAERLGYPEAAPTHYPSGRGDSEKGGSWAVETSALTSRAGWPASQSQNRAWALGALCVRCSRPDGLGGNPPNTPKVCVCAF